MDEFISTISDQNGVYEINEQRIKEHLKNTVPKDVYDKWIEHFVFEEIDDEQITIGYYGTASLKKFEKKYKKMVWLDICSVIGCVKKIKIYKRKKETQPPKAYTQSVKREKKSKKRSSWSNPLQILKILIIVVIIVGIVSVAAVFGGSYISNKTFSENFYNVSSLKVDRKIRIIQISDLHNCSYGKENSILIDRVKKLKPDLIIYTGDCIDSDKQMLEATIELCSKLAEVAPSYYVYGNNEVEMFYDIPLTQEALDKKLGFDDDNREPEKLLEINDSFEEELEKNGVKVLKNEVDTVVVGSTKIDVFGVLTSNPSSFWSYAGNSFDGYVYSDTDHFKLTAIHEPFIFEEFEADFWGDIILSGHTHGGTVRIPMFGPLYTHEGGLLPERSGHFVYGRYELLGKPLIVSSGLENDNIFRINNKPELVIIDINRF